jgi:hypothetical protein
MRLNQNINNYLCTLADVPRERIEGYETILNDFTEFYENSEASSIVPSDFKEYLLEVFARDWVDEKNEILPEVLDTYKILCGYSRYLFGKCILRSGPTQSDVISDDEFQEFMRFISREENPPSHK